MFESRRPPTNKRIEHVSKALGMANYDGGLKGASKQIVKKGRDVKGWWQTDIPTDMETLFKVIQDEAPWKNETYDQRLKRVNALLTRELIPKALPVCATHARNTYEIHWKAAMQAAMGELWPAEEYHQRSTIEEDLRELTVKRYADGSCDLILDYKEPQWTANTNAGILLSTTHRVAPSTRGKGWSTYSRLDCVRLFVECIHPYSSDIALAMAAVKEKVEFFGDMVLRRYGLDKVESAVSTGQKRDSRGLDEIVRMLSHW